MSDAPPSRLSRLAAHPVVRWGERLFWTGLVVFVLVRLGPQLSAWTGIGPTLGSAPAFRLTTLDGKEISSEALRGKVVVVNFWATWCPPCRIEIPALQRLHEERAAEGVVVLGVAADVEGPRVVRPFLEERGVSFSVGMATPELRRAFGGISGFPTTFVIGPDGIIHHRVLGFFAPPAMNAAVERLLED